jgi:hypothetical protein
MTLEFDLKGKLFTNIVPKETCACRIQTTTHLIEGDVHVMPSTRIKDELDTDEPFLPVTHALVLGASREVLFRTDFIAIRRDQVVWISPLKDLRDEVASC